MSSAIGTKVKALVLRTAGTNCEDESVRALQRAGADAEMARTDAAARDVERLGAYGILVFAGGFSYGDDLGSGRVWGSELRAGGLGDALRRHVDRGGVILGVCNGFQVLVESGLFEPDAAPEERSIALYANASNHYECRWVTLREHGGNCAWLQDGLEWPCPVAHGEGRFVVKTAAALERLRANGQLALTYVGQGAGGAGYPANPNGAVADIAGITDPTGRVFGLMPHPERNIDPWNHPEWTRLQAAGQRREAGEGLSFWRRMVEFASK
ncbi:MAG: phosphoribosylformylglycinamidine synthase I [Planctomycetota bacterium]